MTVADVVSLAILAGSTFVSEDLAGIAAGLLAADGTVPLGGAIVATGLGIWAGDLGLWAVGRWLKRPSLANQFLTRHSGAAILTSRFLPGTRLAVYVAAGASGVPFLRFALWAAVASTVWTPLLVGLTALFGEAVAQPLRAYVGAGWYLLPLSVWALWRGRRSLRALAIRLRRLARWEFWPAWLFYAPVVPWVLYLLLTRGARALIAANPGLEDGGFAGESKARILTQLPESWTLAHLRLDSGSAPERVEALARHMARVGWTFPLILKPDVGQRGDGVRLVHGDRDALAYFATHRGPVVAQVYHPGPYEAGIFYYRLPGEARGRIFSLTDKHFPHVVGDGRTTLAELIRRHPRYHLQSPLFFERHQADLARILRPGEPFRLGVAGNHAQGAIFLDGSDLITEALTARIDEIAKQVDGFFIGRFDVRYRDPRAFMAGLDLAIVELNGVTSEATHIYDPSRSLWSAYRTLYEQWRLVFAIGAENLRRGRQAPGFGRLLRLSATHLLGQ